MDKPVAVLGAGSFGITVAKMLAKKRDVLIYARRKETIDQINKQHNILETDLSENIVADSDLEKIAKSCKVIFPIIPSASFRKVMQDLAPYVGPSHFIIHGTKGLDIIDRQNEFQSTRDLLMTMSQVITDETSVLRVGCLAGPNLAKEILDGQPAATVVASEFKEVIDIGKKLLANEQFYVFGSNDILGVELAGAYKNIIAIASGMLSGKGYGQNMQSILITRGLREMIILGRALGTTDVAFLGVAGIGDLIATSTSENSRNFSFGKRLALGETQEAIISSSEVVEGVRTLGLVQKLSNELGLLLPITNVIFKVVFEEFTIEKAISFLMKIPPEEENSFF
jgi:glycerol-3-phosphate dehydrogenase (NAD(P)+)